MKKKDKELLEEMLKKLDFSNCLSDLWKKDLRSNVHLITYGKGEKIIQKGRFAGAFFMVASGRIGIIGEDPENPQVEKEYKELNQGDFFGAYGLLIGGIRVFSVVAKEDTAVFIMGKDVFVKMLKENPGIKDYIDQETVEIRKLLEEKKRKEQVKGEIVEEPADEIVEEREKSKSILLKFRNLLKRKK